MSDEQASDTNLTLHVIQKALREYEDQASDLLDANHQTFPGKLQRFMHLLNADRVLAPLIRDALPVVAFDDWYRQGEAGVGGMVGSGTLEWPVDKRSHLALVKTLLENIAEGRETVFDFCKKFMYPGNNFDLMVGEFNTQIVHPFTRDVGRIIEDAADTIEDQALPGEDETTEDKPVGALRLFISHSSADTELVGELLRWISAALNLRAEEIRCTSIDGYRLPGGADTDQQLRQEVYECEAFIGVISPASIQSMYVVFELGARWGSGKHLLPILAHGVLPGTLKEPLSGIHSLSCDSRGDLHQLVCDLANQLNVKPQPPASYQSAIDRILEFEQPETGQSSTAVDSQRPTVGDIEVQIMTRMPNLSRGEATVSKISDMLGISALRAEFYLNELANKHEFLDWAGNMKPGVPTYYVLTQEGRRFLVERNLA